MDAPAEHARRNGESSPRLMHGLKREQTASVGIRCHALMQNIRWGHYELGIHARAYRRIASVFSELARTI